MAANCVNTETTEFKDTMARLEISEANLETIVFNYQNTEGHENGFPDDNYIVNSLYGTREEVGRNVFDLYNERYQRPAVFMTQEDLSKGMAEATKFFHPNSVTGYMNNSGQYVMLIAKPKLKKEDRTDYNKGTDSTARKSLIQNYKDGINMADRKAAFDISMSNIASLYSDYTPSSTDAFDVNEELLSKADEIERKFRDYIDSVKFVSNGKGGFNLEITPRPFTEIMDNIISDYVENMSEDRVISELESIEMGISFDPEFHLSKKKEEEARRVITKKNTKITSQELDEAILVFFFVITGLKIIK